MTEQPNTSEPAGLWLTITELAERAGLGKPAVSERVARLERAGHLQTRPGRGRSKLVNAAEYDRAVGQVADLGRTQGALTRRGADPEAVPPPPAVENSEPVYTREQARNMAYKAELARLELEERQGKIVSVEIVRAAALRAGEEIVRVLDRLPQAADELAVALAKEGPHGVRLALKRIVLTMRTDIDAALAAATVESLRPIPRASSAAPDFDLVSESGANRTHIRSAPE